MDEGISTTYTGISGKLARIHELVGENTTSSLIPRLVWLRQATGCGLKEAIDLLLEIETRRKETEPCAYD